MHALILGDKSDIAQGLIPKLQTDGWTYSGWNRYERFHEEIPTWDLILCCLGKVSPVGLWFDNDTLEWERSIESNFMMPMRLLREAWPSRRDSRASVCFLAWSNPQKPMKGYSAYHAGKMALLKTVEQLDFETPDVKFFALAPGYVDTKIHKPTLQTGWSNERISKGGSQSLEKIYDCLKWCLAQSKDVVGGRNICVTDPWNAELAFKLRMDPSMYKLRRNEG